MGAHADPADSYTARGELPPSRLRSCTSLHGVAQVEHSPRRKVVER